MLKTGRVLCKITMQSLGSVCIVMMSPFFAVIIFFFFADVIEYKF